MPKGWKGSCRRVRKIKRFIAEERCRQRKGKRGDRYMRRGEKRQLSRGKADRDRRREENRVECKQTEL